MKHLPEACWDDLESAPSIVQYLFSDVQTGSTAVLTADSPGTSLRPGRQHSAQLLHRRGEEGLGGQGQLGGGGCRSVSEV